MAWQEHVADVALEIDPDTGRLAYREVVVSVMRQNGKTTLVLAAECARCLLWGRQQRVAYTAQSGNAARKKFKEDQKPLIEQNLRPVVDRFYMSDGNTSLVWKNGSRINVLDNTPSAGHGMTLDLAVIDEAFTDQDNVREQALLPTMATRPNSQIWNVSTAGTASSTYLLRKVQAGRAAVNSGQLSGLAFFEFAIPESEDIDDPEVHARRMPAYGVTIHSDYIKHARQTMTDGDFRRAIGNQWTETEERVIPAEYWGAVCRHDVRADKEVYVLEAKPDRSTACVIRADKNRRLELVAHRPGISWLADTVDKIPSDAQIVVDGYGPAAGLADELDRTVVKKDSLEVRKACGRFFDAIADGTVSIHADERLDAAAKSAVRKSSSDSWSWHREVEGGELLMALSIGFAHAASNEPWEPVTAWA